MSAESTAETPRTCEKCDRPRTDSRRRFRVTLHDETASTVAFDRFFLCGECWDAVREFARGVRA